MRSVVIAVGLLAALAAGPGLSAGPAAAAGGYLVQLASMGSPEMAQQHWELLRARHAELLGDMTLIVEEANLGTRGTYYRIQIGPFPNEATAEDMCWQIKAQKLDCLVLRR